MNTTSSFDQAKFDAAWKRYDSQEITTESQSASTATFSLLAECISVTVQEGQVCLNLPLGIGRECIDIPDWVPNGEAARACLEIKYRRIFGVKIPVGIEACVYVADQRVACAYFGI